MSSLQLEVAKLSIELLLQVHMGHADLLARDERALPAPANDCLSFLSKQIPLCIEVIHCLVCI